MNALCHTMARLKGARITRDERGIAALEYALIAALIGIAISAGATTFGSSVSDYLSKLGGTVSGLPTSTK